MNGEPDTANAYYNKGNALKALNKFTEVEEVNVEKDLGVYVTSDLNWDKQVSHVCYKANFNKAKIRIC